MYPQQTSFIKRTGQGARREFQIMHLAVFPFQAEFLKNSELNTLAYFQKGNQIIGINGERPITIPPANKGEKVRLSSLGNIIKFHVYSESNVVYKWSLYRKHQNGEEEYLQSCAFNLREIVVNYILPLRSEALSMINSTIGNDFHQKQLRGKFVKTGIILNFALIISNDLAAIERHVSRRYCEGLHNFKINTQAIEITNEEVIDVSSMGDKLSQDSFQSASMLSEQPLLKNESKHGDKSKLEREGSEEKAHERNSSVHYSTPDDAVALDLDELILSEEKQKEGNSIENIVKEQGGEDLNFGVENETKTSLEGQKPQKAEPEQKKQPRGRDYSLLRIESDKNGLEPEQADDKLEREQLDMIEEQKTSMKGTVKASSLNSRPRPAPGSLLLKPKPLPISQPQKPSLKPSQLSQSVNFKKLILFFIAIAIALMFAALYNYNLRKTKYRGKGRGK